MIPAAAAEINVAPHKPVPQAPNPDNAPQENKNWGCRTICNLSCLPVGGYTLVASTGGYLLACMSEGFRDVVNNSAVADYKYPVIGAFAIYTVVSIANCYLFRKWMPERAIEDDIDQLERGGEQFAEQNAALDEQVVELKVIEDNFEDALKQRGEIQQQLKEEFERPIQVFEEATLQMKAMEKTFAEQQKIYSSISKLLELIEEENGKVEKDISRIDALMKEVIPLVTVLDKLLGEFNGFHQQLDFFTDRLKTTTQESMRMFDSLINKMGMWQGVIEHLDREDDDVVQAKNMLAHEREKLEEDNKELQEVNAQLRNNLVELHKFLEILEIPEVKEALRVALAANQGDEGL